MKNKTVKIKGFDYKLAAVRPSLIKRDLAVPVGNDYYLGEEPLPYRYTGEDGEDFQVYLNGKWQSAESIDFNF